MRKLFRFKYEPCNGTCYAYCDILVEELTKLEEVWRKFLVFNMVQAHAKLCDNPDYSFGVDMDENTGMFAAHFRTPEKTDLYLNPNFSDCVNEVCKAVMNAEIPQVAGQCNYGDHGSEDLGKEILRLCEDTVYREERHQNCACKKAV